MEHLDYLPFIQFIRDDRETVEIMQEALTIIPKVIDFLEGNLQAFNSIPIPTPMSMTVATPSSSAEENAETTESSQTSSPTINSDKKMISPTAGNSSQSLPLKRGNLESNAESSTITKNYGVPPKKLKIPFTEPGTTATESPISNENNSEPQPTLDQVRQRLQEDYDKFVRQIGDLASLEREKNKLLGKFLSVSAVASGSENDATSSLED